MAENAPPLDDVLPVVALPTSAILPGERRVVELEDEVERATALHCVESACELGVARRAAGWEDCPVDAVPIRERFGAASLEAWRRTDGGVLQLSLFGRRRVRAREVLRLRPVRLVAVEPAPDRVADEARLRNALASLDRVLALRLRAGRDPGAGLRALGGTLAEVFGRAASRFELPDGLRQRIVECDDVAERLELLVRGLSPP